MDAYQYIYEADLCFSSVKFSFIQSASLQPIFISEMSIDRFG
ncbi:hypothetical protein E5S67_04292 [Microcoleus sp. IPMA8]|uniref:Uncharacterized protein n=1 Tax=Microcoleus asticus IPMA8 TaxID=2563858 RepID=A0ABX2D3I2_9CYAN|nr:hypothetical protein [Microcoleus asticus IPMA8]